jgi:Alternative complex III, ActD subunit
MIEPRSHLYGVIGEFETPKQVLEAARKMREAGYKDIDAYSPYPLEGLSEALGLGRKENRVPLITLIGGLFGGLGGFFFQYWANVYSFPENIGGRPYNSWPAFIPVTFEMTVLFASIFSVLGMLGMNKLPQPHHPLFNSDRFQKHASADRFFVCIEATDPKFELAGAKNFLQGLSAQNVAEVEDE